MSGGRAEIEVKLLLHLVSRQIHGITHHQQFLRLGQHIPQPPACGVIAVFLEGNLRPALRLHALAGFRRPQVDRL